MRPRRAHKQNTAARARTNPGTCGIYICSHRLRPSLCARRLHTRGSTERKSRRREDKNRLSSRNGSLTPPKALTYPPLFSPDRDRMRAHLSPLALLALAALAAAAADTAGECEREADAPPPAHKKRGSRGLSFSAPAPFARARPERRDNEQETADSNLVPAQLGRAVATPRCCAHQRCRRAPRPSSRRREPAAAHKSPLAHQKQPPPITATATPAAPPSRRSPISAPRTPSSTVFIEWAAAEQQPASSSSSSRQSAAAGDAPAPPPADIGALLGGTLVTPLPPPASGGRLSSSSAAAAADGDSSSAEQPPESVFARYGAVRFASPEEAAASVAAFEAQGE